MHGCEVSIPSSSGMGVGQRIAVSSATPTCLNTFFIRYGCRTRLSGFIGNLKVVSIPSSSGMGVGRLYDGGHRKGLRSQYLLHQVWVSDSWEKTSPYYFRGLNTFFIRYGCRTVQSGTQGVVDVSQYLLHQVWVSDVP